MTETKPSLEAELHAHFVRVADGAQAAALRARAKRGRPRHNDVGQMVRLANASADLATAQVRLAKASQPKRKPEVTTQTFFVGI